MRKKEDPLTLSLKCSFIQLAFIEGLGLLVLGEVKLLFCSSSDLNHESAGKVSQLLHQLVDEKSVYLF